MKRIEHMKTWKKKKEIVWKFHENSSIIIMIVDFIVGVFVLRKVFEKIWPLGNLLKIQLFVQTWF